MAESTSGGDPDSSCPTAPESPSRPRPLRTLHVSDGTGRLHAVLSIPSAAPADLYGSGFQPDLRLFVEGELVREHAGELLPHWLRWVRGTVELSAALALGAREGGRQRRMVRHTLAAGIVKALREVMESDRAGYEGFWREMGDVVKEAVGRTYEVQDAVLDLLLFHSSLGAGRLTTLKEYVARMPPGQEHIWYVAAEDAARGTDAPVPRVFHDRGWEVLHLASSVDAQVVASLVAFQGRRLRAVERDDARSPVSRRPALGEVFVGRLKMFAAAP